MHAWHQQKLAAAALRAVLAYLIAALSPNMDVANGALPAYVVINLFFVGLLIRPQDQPDYWCACMHPAPSSLREHRFWCMSLSN